MHPYGVVLAIYRRIAETQGGEERSSPHGLEKLARTQVNPWIFVDLKHEYFPEEDLIEWCIILGNARDHLISHGFITRAEDSSGTWVDMERPFTITQ